MSENEELSREETLWKQARENEGIERASAYHQLSKIEYDNCNYKEAMSMCLVAKEIYEKESTKEHYREIIDIYEGMSSIHEYLNECTEAEAALNKAIEIARREDSPLLGDLLRTSGRRFFEHEKYDESIAAHTESMLVPLEDQDGHSRGVDYLNIGMAHNRKKEYALAVRSQLEALKIFKEEDVDPYWIINTRAELSSSYLGLENAYEVFDHAQVALDWFETEENFQKVMVLKYYTGVALRMIGQLDDAIDTLEESREVAKKYARNFHEFAVDVDKEVGEIMIMQGKVDAGRELIRRAKSVSKSLTKTNVELPANDEWVAVNGQHS